MTVTESAAERKRLGAWYTPPAIVDVVVEQTVVPAVVERAQRERRPVRILDPACGDGRFLAAAAARVQTLDGTAAVTGVDIDGGALDAAAASPNRSRSTAASVRPRAVDRCS